MLLLPAPLKQMKRRLPLKGSDVVAMEGAGVGRQGAQG